MADSQVLSEDLRLGRLAEPLGFDSIWTVEHHFSALTIVPNPLQFLTYFAGCTKQIELGTMVVVLPWHDPARVAEEIATLDNMLEGRRLNIGLGRGVGRREFEGLRIPADESRERFAEALEIVRQALTEERFAFEGRHYSVPETELRPRPRSPDLVSRMRVAWMGSETVPLVAQTGLGMLVGNQKPWEAAREDVQRFNAVRAEHGLGDARPTVLIAAVCDEDEREAERLLQRHWLEQRQSIARHYEAPGALAGGSDDRVASPPERRSSWSPSCGGFRGSSAPRNSPSCSASAA